MLLRLAGNGSASCYHDLNQLAGLRSFRQLRGCHPYHRKFATSSCADTVCSRLLTARRRLGLTPAARRFAIAIGAEVAVARAGLVGRAAVLLGLTVRALIADPTAMCRGWRPTRTRNLTRVSPLFTDKPGHVADVLGTS